MGKVPDCDLPFLINVRNKRSAVVDAEVEDTVLIGGLERNAKDSGVGSLRYGRKVEAVEGGKHAELELDVVICGGDERNQLVVGVLRDLNLVVLYCC